MSSSVAASAAALPPLVSVEAGDRRLFYRRYGKGPKIVFAFPGYDTHSALFRFLQDETLSVFGFEMPFDDLPFEEDLKPLQPIVLAETLRNIAKAEKSEKFYLAGFSIGCRLAAGIFAARPDWFLGMFFAAPDGLRSRNLYSFLSASPLGIKLFRHFVYAGNVYGKLFAALNAMALLPRKKFAFAKVYIDSRTARERLYMVWRGTALFASNFARVKKLSEENGVPIHLFMSETDAVIPVADGRKYAGNTVQLHLCAGGHRLMSDKNFREAFRSCVLKAAKA